MPPVPTNYAQDASSELIAFANEILNTDPARLKDIDRRIATHEKFTKILSDSFNDFHDNRANRAALAWEDMKKTLPDSHQLKNSKPPREILHEENMKEILNGYHFITLINLLAVDPSNEKYRQLARDIINLQSEVSIPNQASTSAEASHNHSATQRQQSPNIGAVNPNMVWEPSADAQSAHPSPSQSLTSRASSGIEEVPDEIMRDPSPSEQSARSSSTLSTVNWGLSGTEEDPSIREASASAASVHSSAGASDIIEVSSSNWDPNEQESEQETTSRESSPALSESSSGSYNPKESPQQACTKCERIFLTAHAQNRGLTQEEMDAVSTNYSRVAKKPGAWALVRDRITDIETLLKTDVEQGQKKAVLTKMAERTTIGASPAHRTRSATAAATSQNLGTPSANTRSHRARRG
jgi:hypothetical protein